MRKKTTEEFIKEVREKHGDKYDYSKVEYVGTNTKICIICPKHGEFEQIPYSHLRGCGCPKCYAERLALTKEDFIKKACEVHKDKYDYSKVKYVNNYTKVCIIDPEYGEFLQTPANHLNGKGCYKRSGKSVPTREEWIASARKVHGDKYNYSKVAYVNSKTKVCIICPEHGEFKQRPSHHLNGVGCPKCGHNASNDSKRLSLSDFIKKANEVHKGKYDYSKVKYVNAITKVCIICHKHDEFWQSPSAHLQGQGCPTCANESNGERCRLSLSDFIKKANEVHKDKYDYSKVNYVNAQTKIYINCPEHGEFWQTPNKHLQGKGCPKCNLSHLERSVMNYLDEHEIAYDYQKRFNWLGLQSLDFYLPDYNVGIECQGIQHFEEIDYFGGKEGLNECKKRDKLKFKKCQKNGIKVLYYSNLGIEYPYDVFEDLDLLFEEIKNIQVKNK